ncbi:hypothetical protein DYBT9623_03134 [Dyadobacter sp. CECT 9623]|uniref:Fido domain-containing protein n=1 Tax=Dyadobacter linearis TaxID=2823330 RepID=A0ABM8USC2_9BACT|nr:Fic family protein [Dyadobacter sp. CECT 9623]CAG5070588.1 hypothetical protein DYBT9623_03134 [Dyadobacter sp. CECT 9623]
MALYIHQKAGWPEFTWEESDLSRTLGEVRYLQGVVAGRMQSLGFLTRTQAALKTLTEDILKSTEIEGEHLDPDQVRSSIARRLGLEIAGLVPSDRNVEGVVEMTLDATQNFTDILTDDRLFGWHSSLFPSGKSVMFAIATGRWRDGGKGPMQVVSGAIGRETVHFEAPDAARLEEEMRIFFTWFNSNQAIDPVLKSGIAHLWFVTIHPFNDGNGRIARAIADMQLARAEGSAQRYYSMSSQIRKRRNEYYEVLEKTQKNNLEITDWLNWYLQCLKDSLGNTLQMLDVVLQRAAFWDKNADVTLNARQQLMVRKMEDDFFGKLTTSKWAKITKSSQDTAGRDIQDLINKGILYKDEAGGRSSNYILIW